MCGQVCNAANGVALNFDIGGHHLPYQGRKTTKENDGNFVLGYHPISIRLSPWQTTAYYSRPNSPAQHWPLFVLLCRHFVGGRGWAQGCLGRLL